MASMSLSFILCNSKEDAATRTDEECEKKKDSLSAVFQANGNGSSENAASKQILEAQNHSKCDIKHTLPLDRQHHVRKLQNMRQRRYRDRKKITASALQASAEQLHQENAALESAILKVLGS